MPIAREWNKSFFDHWSPEMAYVLGFMIADGYVYRNSAGGMYFCFCSTDLEIIEAIRNVLEADHKIGVKPPNKKFLRSKALYILQIGSIDICAKLSVFGIIQNKSLTIAFPEVPARFLGDFVRGYFDGDGSVNFGKYWVKSRCKWRSCRSKGGWL